ncbi:PREDICTED: ribonuclease [Prunus dulcis]|uniref:PREDICTED: ribonuclease n=1 Tax=Prunus dulcis TaxID=3755 RepID=A0A5E4GD48_PRUDU|nr:PREDICTED: ribonuclease [Prunus dulcis]
METGARGAGAIVSDSQGNLIGALAMCAPSRISVLATELYALKIGISFALDASLMPLEIETDSLLVVSMVNSEEDCLAAEGGLVEAVRCLLASSASSPIRHIPRQANKVAHRIAHFSLRDQSLSCWIDVGLLSLMDAVSDDRPESTVIG